MFRDVSVNLQDEFQLLFSLFFQNYAQILPHCLKPVWARKPCHWGRENLHHFCLQTQDLLPDQDFTFVLSLLLLLFCTVLALFFQSGERRWPCRCEISSVSFWRCRIYIPFWISSMSFNWNSDFNVTSQHCTKLLKSHRGSTPFLFSRYSQCLISSW